MTLPTLGRLTTMKVTDVWENEPRGFTPWLALPDNLTLLCEILGLDELVDVKQEDAVGRYRVDILARDQDGGTVVIENQFGRTDHGHLGQIMTYLAGQQGRVTVIWIAERFNEEHRAVVDWLNANSGDDYTFFAVEVEVLRIGASEPAPWFNVVAKPNIWSRSIRAGSSDAESAEIASRHTLRMSYWSSFAEYLQAHSSEFRIKRANKDHWFSFASGRSGSVISATISVERYKRIGVELYNHGDGTKAIFDALHAQRDEIEREIGVTLEWQRLDGRKATRIVLYRTGEDPSDPLAWPRQHAWMLDYMVKFRRTFGSRLKALPLSGFRQADDEA
ncbi:DUF4268 domain-containing protein [Ancylobacter sonchi]|uniref:DUF4268 domain-containing protein n=1 Tax=Ancylobacter sonchi TaxID=1937790 RepID=UPI001BD570D4|nr:DUF4268 domain-containing protein [Ancylobacter sonchi]MBS7532291.1 DUF4268 domain-containing protein [Ancylobacter sonchi]